jgi:hypothetical protein
LRLDRLADGAKMVDFKLQTKKLFNADVLGEFEQGIEMLVLAQRLAIDFNFER